MKEKECVQSAGRTVWKHRQKHKDSTALQSKPDMVCTPHLNVTSPPPDYVWKVRVIGPKLFWHTDIFRLKFPPNVLNRILIHPLFSSSVTFLRGGHWLIKQALCSAKTKRASLCSVVALTNPNVLASHSEKQTHTCTGCWGGWYCSERRKKMKKKNVEFNHNFIVWCMRDGAVSSPRRCGQEDGDFVHTLVVSVRFFYYIKVFFIG